MYVFLITLQSKRHYKPDLFKFSQQGQGRNCQEITKRENSSSEKHNLSKIELFNRFTDTGHSNSVRKKSTYVKSQKILVLDKKNFHSKPLTNGQMT